MAQLLLPHPVVWLANALTLSRLPLAGLFWLAYGHIGWSLAIVAVAALTDALDGTIARRARARSGHPQDLRGSAGEWLDPAADKIFVVVALAAAVAHGAPWQLAIMVVARELVLVPLALAYRLALFARPHVAHAFQADPIGKAATIAQLAAVTAIVGRASLALPLAIIAGALGLVAAAHYVARARGGGGQPARTAT